MHEGGGRWVGSNKVVELKKKKKPKKHTTTIQAWDSQVELVLKNLPEMQEPQETQV